VIRGKEIDNYAVRMSYGNRQRSLSLQIPNRDQAAQIARDWFVYLSAIGWAAFDAKYRTADPPAPRPSSPGPVKSKGVTVGDFLAAARNESDLAHKTFDDYARCLRFIISEIRAMTKTRTRHDYRNGGRKAWVAAVDAMPLEELTADKIRAWKRVYVGRAAVTTNLRGAGQAFRVIHTCVGLGRCSVGARFWTNSARSNCRRSCPLPASSLNRAPIRNFMAPALSRWRCCGPHLMN
jgi:hypothetical protein